MAGKPRLKKDQGYSLVSGGGAGSGLMVWISNLHASDNEKLLLQAVAAWVAVAVSAIAPYIFKTLMNFAKYYSCKFLIWRSKRQLRKIPDDDEHRDLRAKGRSNIIELEGILMDFNSDTAKNIVTID